MIYFFVEWKNRCVLVFFFQAEDGIRALYVTGVQTCALPICGRGRPRGICLPARGSRPEREQSDRADRRDRPGQRPGHACRAASASPFRCRGGPAGRAHRPRRRSERERHAVFDLRTRTVAQGACRVAAKRASRECGGARSTPSGLLRNPSPDPGTWVCPYCHTILFVRGSTKITRWFL